MGWYRIDPETGESLKAGSKLSSPNVKLLNAVPGVDDESDACYLGDGPSDMSSTVPDEVEEAVGKVDWSPEQIRALFLEKRIPAGTAKAKAPRLLEIVELFWKDIDSCYEDDWERGAKPEEKRWICEYVVNGLTGGE